MSSLWEVSDAPSISMNTSGDVALVWKCCSDRALNRKYRWSVEVFFLLTSGSLSAISRGAVIHGLTQQKIESPLVSQVRSRVSRASYGVVCQEKWNHAKHDDEDYILNDDTGERKAVRQMKWIVRLVRSKAPLTPASSHVYVGTLTFIRLLNRARTS